MSFDLDTITFDEVTCSIDRQTTDNIAAFIMKRPDLAIWDRSLPGIARMDRISNFRDTISITMNDIVHHELWIINVPAASLRRDAIESEGVIASSFLVVVVH